MNTSDLSHADELIFAEVTAALTEAMTKEYAALKIQYDADALSPNDLASSPKNLNETQGSLLHGGFNYEM